MRKYSGLVRTTFMFTMLIGGAILSALAMGNALAVPVIPTADASSASMQSSVGTTRGPLDDWKATPPIHIKRAASTSPTGLFPAAILKAYGTDQLQCSRTGLWGDSQLCGYGQVIAIVDAYGYPTAESDLNTFSSKFNLPECTTANGCLDIHPMANRVRADSGWALEEALDIQWAHAIAPGAKILLVQAKSSFGNDLLAAVNYAELHRSSPSVDELGQQRIFK